MLEALCAGARGPRRDLEFPDDVTLSTPFTITAEIRATAPTTARVSLQQNAFYDIQGRAIELEQGINRVALTAEVYEPGRRDHARAGADGPIASRRTTASRTIEVWAPRGSTWRRGAEDLPAAHHAPNEPQLTSTCGPPGVPTSLDEMQPMIRS